MNMSLQLQYTAFSLSPKALRDTLKVLKKRLRPWAPPRTQLGSSRRSPDPLVGLGRGHLLLSPLNVFSVSISAPMHDASFQRTPPKLFLHAALGCVHSQEHTVLFRSMVCMVQPLVAYRYKTPAEAGGLPFPRPRPATAFVPARSGVNYTSSDDRVPTQ